MDKLVRLNKAKCIKYYHCSFLKNKFVIPFKICRRSQSTASAITELKDQTIFNNPYNSTISHITFNPNGSYKMFKFDQDHKKILIDETLHTKYMSFTSIDILESLVLWSLLSNKRNIPNLNKDPLEIKQYLTDIGFIKFCPPSIFTKYFSWNFINKLDAKLTSASYSDHSQLNFIVTRSLQIFDFLHWRLLNNATTEHIQGAKAMRKHAQKYKSQLQIDADHVISVEALKTLRYLRIDYLYLSLYDIALHDIGSVPLSYSILSAWIDHGFHLFIAANPGHLNINIATNPLHEMYCNAFYHIVSDKPRFVDIKQEYGKKIPTANLNNTNSTFVFNMLFYHILEHFGVGNATSMIKKVLLRCIIFDRNKYRNSDGYVKDLGKELSVFEDKKFAKAFSDIFNVYGKNWKHSIKDRLYSIIIRYFVSVGEIDAAQYVYNMARKYNYFGVLDKAYNLIKICEALNTFIENGLFLANNAADDNIAYMYHSDPLSGYSDTYEYFTTRVQQCIDLLAKMMIDRDQMLLSMAAQDLQTNTKQNKAHKLTDSERIKLEKLTANYGLDITTITHRILYSLNQIQIAIKQYEIATNNKNKLRFNYCDKLLNSLVFIEKVQHKYPLSNDWSYLKLSEQKQMFLDIANGIRSGVLISIICDISSNIKPPTKILRLRLLNHYGSLWHIIPFKDVLSSTISISDILFNTFLQSLNINILPHSDYKIATFFRICSLYLTNLSLTNELKKNDILTLSNKLLNILEYAVGDIVNDKKSTSENYFLLNIKLLILSIKNPYKCYASNTKNEQENNNELKCIFMQNIYDKMMIDSELIKQNKHFIPDLELSEMILFEWFLYFQQNYKKTENYSNTFRELFLKNNLMNDLLEYSISMNVFDSVTSHPLIFHLTILSKLINLLKNDIDINRYQISKEIANLWNHKGLADEYYEPIKVAMTSILANVENDSYILMDDISVIDDIVNHLKQIWSPYFIELQNNKINKRTNKQNKRWQEMIEPQLMSVMSPKQMRFTNYNNTFTHFTVSKWFNKEKITTAQPQEFVMEPHESDQTQFEEFVNTLNIEYLNHLVSYDKFIKSKRLERELSINDYITNLNEDGVYVDPGMSSFVTCIEPLIQSIKAQKAINAAADHHDLAEDAIDFIEVGTFLDEIETIYNDVVCRKEEKAKSKERHELMRSNKIEFLEQLNSLFRDKPRLLLFLDAVQQVINNNKYKLNQKKKTYSLSSIAKSNKFQPRYIGNDAINMDFYNWDEFEMNITKSERKEERKEIKYLNPMDYEDDGADDKANKMMIGDLNQKKMQKFLESIQTLPIKTNMSQETYALTKLVKELDQMY